MTLILVPYVTEECEAMEDGFRTLIMTKGRGGDAAGAALLRQLWHFGQPDLVNLSQTPLRMLETSKYHCLLIIGQDAVGDVARSDAMHAKLAGRRVGLYTHLIDQNTLELIQKIGDQAALNLFSTHSQVTLLKLRHIATDRLEAQQRHAWKQASQVIATVSPQKRAAGNGKRSPLEDSNNVIWLGGHYTTSAGTKRVFTTDEITASLKFLKGVIKSGTSVAIILSPRVFERRMSTQQKAKRLLAIRDAFSQNKITFYGSKALVSSLGDIGVSLQIAPSYNELMHIPWRNQTMHYASADQYNLFVDMNTRIEPFLLDPNDADQALYAIDYRSGNKANLTSVILKTGCKMRTKHID